MAIYILVTPELWEIAQKRGLLYERSLASEGFVHASHWNQLERVANVYFQDVATLLVLAIDPALVMPPIRWERSASTGEEYPHIYGPLNVNAARVVDTLNRGDSGRFTVPAEEPVASL